MDLNNLNGVLKTGKILEENAKNTTFYTPVFRGVPFALDKPGTAKGHENKTPKWSIMALWNVNSKEERGKVDLHPVFFKAIRDLAKRARIVDIEGLDDEDGMIRRVQSGVVKLFEPTAVAKNKDKEGNFRPGTGVGVFSSNFSMYPSEQYPDDKPKLIDGHNNVLLPRECLRGYWYRLFAQVYASKHGTLALGFTTVQLIAKDETFGGARPSGDMEDVEGAEDFRADVGATEDIDDIDME